MTMAARDIRRWQLLVCFLLRSSIILTMMMIKRHSIMLGRIASILLLVYWIALATGTHVPGSAVEAVHYNDKVAHFLGYMGLAFLMCFAWATHRPFRWRTAVVIWGIAIAYGAVDELLQIPIPGRSGEIGDWVADTLGSLLGTFVFCVLLALVRVVIDRGARLAGNVPNS